MLGYFRQKKSNQEDYRIRQTRVDQISIFEKYSQHELGLQLERLSNILDRFPEILDLIEHDLINASCKNVGANGLAVETIFAACY
jgi:IS5 family transposase